MFVDRVQIRVIAGDGGNGVCSFRREKFIAKGGPDGGDGGHGGNIVFKVDPELGTLMDFRYRRTIRAKNGRHGEGANRTGRSGRDTYVKIPPGTIVYNDETNEVIADLTKKGHKMVIAAGGKGGKGNARFSSSTNRAPRKFTLGKVGEEIPLRLELKLLADVGLVGLPNAGKSTLLSVVSAARPEIAAYPFTTLTPHLGIVKVREMESFVMADIPGLIEGAADGKGLGHQFLSHVERTKVLAILVAMDDPKPDETLQVLLKELEDFNPDLLRRPRVIVRTKTDIDLDYGCVDQEEPSREWGKEDFAISAVTGEGVKELLSELMKHVHNLRLEEEEAERVEEELRESDDPDRRFDEND